MRHVGSLVLSLIFTAVIYVLAGVGVVQFAKVNATADTDWAAAGIGMAALAGAGLLYAILVLARLSPLGMMLSGLVLMGATLWALISPSSYADRIPADVLGVDGAGHAAAGAITLLLSVPLLGTVFSPRRWRQYPNGAPALVAPSGYPPESTPYPMYTPPAESGYPAPTSGAPTYPTMYTPPADPYAASEAADEPTVAGSTAPNPAVANQPASAPGDDPTRPM